MSDRALGWREIVFKNRGALLVPVPVALVIFGLPTARSARLGVGVAALGEALRIWAVGYSGRTTRSNVVTAPELVTAGPYALTRNPLYIGNALIALGFWTAFAGAIATPRRAALLAFVGALVVGVYAVIIPLEERYLDQVFGPRFEEYCAHVPRLVAAGRSMPPAKRNGVWRAQVIARAEVITLGLFGVMAIVAALRARGR
ncbi:MAG: isoprenylcysteine carboxylmethyltransferase family protein [Candidatus Eremiobacteraeota bacterium]|nr:isoprenylcysteine carboxylmethyltransferase family protein [Candidatus Eremiobacteraeota bacterium]